MGHGPMDPWACGPMGLWTVGPWLSPLKCPFGVPHKSSKSLLKVHRKSLANPFKVPKSQLEVPRNPLEVP